MKIEACSSIKGGKYRVHVPREWVMLLAIDTKQSAYSRSETFRYGLVSFMEREILDICSGTLPDLEIAADSIIAPAWVAEWLVERQGWSHTNRFKNDLLWSVDVDEITEIDDDLIIIKHDRHFVTKSTSAETQTLLSIRWAQYHTALPHAGISDLAKCTEVLE